MNQVRVRFAPSPTGALHLGGVRTALFNYLFARHYNGTFILRIEDTDQTRYVEGAEEYIINALRWCNLTIDEGVSVGGPHAPYRQSERKPLYRQYALDLIENGWAYYAFDTAEELDALRKASEAEGQTFIYGQQNRANLKNSLALTKEEVEERIQNGEPYVIRFKMPNETLLLHDEIRGDVTFETALLDDKVLFKSDGMPTYHLANVVDDHLMEITHVIRGEEWLPSLPLHHLLYRAFGWTETMPAFAHLPLILKPVGNGKLSKRDGNKMGFPVFPLEFKDPATGDIWHGYREDGYLPEAFINMLALLGWNPGTDEEFFTMEQLSEAFTLERVNKSGARFNPEKAKWFNHKYLNEKSNEEVAVMLKEALLKQGITPNENLDLQRIVALLKERATFVSDIVKNSMFFYEAPTVYDEKSVKKHWKPESKEILCEIITRLSNLEAFTTETIEEALRSFATERELGLGKVMSPLRLALLGTADGPNVGEVASILNQTETIHRIEHLLDTLPTP